MRRRSLLAGITLVFDTLFVTVHHARAQAKPFPVGLRVGETFEVCTSGWTSCLFPREAAGRNPRGTVPIKDLPGFDRDEITKILERAYPPQAYGGSRESAGQAGEQVPADDLHFPVVWYPS